MYTIDDNDRLQNIKDVPRSSPGAPIPYVLANENFLILAYYAYELTNEWNKNVIKDSPLDSGNDFVSIIKFERAYAHMFGPPNDEAISGHPLAERGLESYSAYIVNDSSWVRILEKMNSVHPSHNKDWFLTDKKHYIFTFHDSTFECIAKDFIVEIYKTSMKKVMPILIDTLVKMK